MTDVDVMIIGAGIAGLSAVKRLLMLGARFAFLRRRIAKVAVSIASHMRAAACLILAVPTFTKATPTR